jgi:hypothetical protein
MEICPRTAAERAVKLQEVLLRALAGKIKWVAGCGDDRYQQASAAPMAEAH